MVTMSGSCPIADASSIAHAAAAKNRLSPGKLLLSKWTALTPRNKEKHFVVICVTEPKPPDVRVDKVELEAVHTRHTLVLLWRDLTDGAQWRQGGV